MQKIQAQVVTEVCIDQLLDEQQLIAAAKAGCTTCFEVLVERYYHQILCYLLRQTGDRELAADLTQETFLDAFRRLDRLTVDRPIAAWLYRIAHYNLLHERRRQRLRPSISLDCLLAEGNTSSSALHMADGTAFSHERDLVRQILGTLSPSLRVALLLASVCGFSSQDVADMEHIPAATARERVHRAKQAFRRRYQALDENTQTTALP